MAHQAMRKRASCRFDTPHEALEPRVLLSGLHPLSDLPALNSNPNAYAQVYLDFDGAPATTWQEYAVPPTPAYDQDGDPSTFSDKELLHIREIWAQVAEKFSPFNINVTTVEPSDYEDRHALGVIIGGNGAWIGKPGGVSRSGAFYQNYENFVYIFPANLNNGNPRHVADATAHEVGHAFGLQHQSVYSGTVRTQEYNPGDALRAPIMGLPYYAARSLWWNGPSSVMYFIMQDDLERLTRPDPYAAFGYRPDDHANEPAQATSLTVSGTSASAAGIIEQMTDADYFSFTTTGGNVSFTVNVAQYGPMLDATAEIRDADDNLIAVQDTTSLGETISADLAAGTYYLVVKSHGSYGDLGQYTVTGTVPSDGQVPVAPLAHAGGPYTVAEGGTVQLNASQSTGTNLIYLWDLDNDGIFGETGADAAHGDETGLTPTFRANSLDGPSTWPISLKVVAGIEHDIASIDISITNVAPTLSLSGNNTVAEGSTYPLNLSTSEPGPDTISQWTIDWGDGHTQTVTGNPSSITHTYADDGIYTIAASATDEDGTFAAPSKIITVVNVAPTLTITGSGSARQGSEYTLALASSDPGQDVITQWTIDWGDGTTQTVTGNPESATHTYDAGGTYTISASATDEDGTYTANTQQVAVSSVVPVFSISGSDLASEASIYTLNLSADQMIDTWQIDWGDGNTQTYTDNPASVTHTYADSGSYTIRATVTNANGTFTSGGKLVSVTNVAPTLSLSGDPSINEGSVYTLNLSASDPGQDTISQWTIDWGDGNTETINGNPASVAHTYADNGRYTITASATDEDGTYDVPGETVDVNDVAPTIALAGDTATDEGAIYTLTLGAITDPGRDTVTSWIVDWGDGTTSTYETGGEKVHTYADGANSAIITVTLVNEDGIYANAASLNLTVNNVDPILTLSGADSAKCNVVYTLNLSASDPGQDRISLWIIDWGDGNTQEVVDGRSSVVHTYTARGQYTITASALDDDGTHVANAFAVKVRSAYPQASSTPDHVSSIGGTEHQFTVEYVDDLGIDTKTLDDNDILVTGPNSFRQKASLISIVSDGAAGTTTATYRITAPGGAWDASDNGSYTLILQANEVGNTAGDLAPSLTLASFNVNLATPPVAHAGGPYTLFTGETLRLDATNSSGTDLTYLWDLDNDGFFGESADNATRGIETSASPTFSALDLTPGSYIVRLRVTDATGLSSQTWTTVTVLGLPQLVGTANDDAFTLRLSADGTQLELYESDSPSPSCIITPDQIDNLRIAGNGGTDTLTIDRSNGDPLASMSLQIESGTLKLKITNGLNVLRLTGLFIAEGSTLDLEDNDLIISATSETRQQVLAQVSDWIKAARGSDGKWQGTGLTSSAAQANKHAALSVILNASDDRPIHSAFSDLPVTVNDILVKYTWNGDVTLDGRVDASDYFLVDRGFLGKLTGYRNGDLNFDGKINISDYALIDAAFLSQRDVLLAAKAAASEPQDTLLLQATSLTSSQTRLSITRQLFSTDPLL